MQNVPASAEICDGLDNDCDGVEDSSTTDTGDSCNTGELGVCAAGTTICVGGVIECEQNLQPSTEVCNGLDDDCDGTPDQGFPGAGQHCTVPGQNPNTPCAQGEPNCLQGQSNCTQTVFPSSETCDGVDNDCDGTIDNPEFVDDEVCSTGLPGVCATGRTQCNTGTHGTATCSGGGCGITCDANWDNCDGDVTNGCEADLLNSASMCGNCSTQCSSSGGAPSCARSRSARSSTTTTTTRTRPALSAARM
ncbi:MAG: MopE-related protein, partial [Myxococcota bacterium]